MKQLRTIALLPILGKPLVIYFGIVTLISFLTTAVIGALILKGKNIPLKKHLLMAKISITIALIHGLLAFSIFF